MSNKKPTEKQLGVLRLMAGLGCYARYSVFGRHYVIYGKEGPSIGDCLTATMGALEKQGWVRDDHRRTSFMNKVITNEGRAWVSPTPTGEE